MLDEITVFDGHADLVAKGEKQAQLGWGKAAIVRCAEKEEAEGLFLGLQADPHDRAQMLARGQLPETPEGFLAFQSRPGSVAPEIAENDEAAQPNSGLR